MSTVVELEIEGSELLNNFQDLSIGEQTEVESNSEERYQVDCENNYHGDCAICLNKIVLQETALVKGCEHAYCVTCILRWATYKNEPTCPQCKHPFEFLHIHRSLDGSIQDYMFEESVCLLLRASWFEPFVEEIDDYMDYEDDEELEDFHVTSSPSLRISNRRWGNNGYVRAGRQEASPAHPPSSHDSSAGSSRQTTKNETAVSKVTVGRRAKRTLKREAADKAAAKKHQSHLLRLGRT
ncbi:uncharacterized protein [Solanum lycopersicum]|uniref:uncharacterized protein n=1 Tax=Solanum lycopersicum TaxID=4081 RepID=UPI000276331B|nr:uncharacterized protein LOC101258982 [Solanum lycopersicum]